MIIIVILISEKSLNIFNFLLLTQIRRAAQTTTLAVPMVVSKGHLGPSAHVRWVIN